MKTPMSIYWPINDKGGAFRAMFEEILQRGASGGTTIIHERGGGQTMQVIERRVKVAVGLNEMARKLGCSRGHLSLVIHGHRKSNPPVQNSARPDRLTVNGVDYDLSPAIAEGLFSCYQNLKKKAGRPKGSAVRFPGIKAFAAEQGVTPLHVYMVLTGKRQSRRVTAAWQRQRGA